MSLQRTTNIPESIIYTAVDLPSSICATPTVAENLKKILILKIQGEAVEISEEYPLPLLMGAFDVIHRFSPEMILRLKSGEKVLIFSHWEKNILRDKDIKVIKIKPLLPPQNIKKKKNVINLKTIWKKTKKEKNFLKAIETSLKKAITSIKPAEITILQGKAPSLLFLLTQHMLYGQTRKIWYQENKEKKPIKITRL